ncbi:coiled-coil domain-containing protein 120 isoform X2 [Alligator mississippiensis]|uniref:Coiled-coil domain-containing protein 120 isoform B n=1 Tax=Alligator mississippiensis TaxID=8496 RepID=A0A151NDK2_ALLMI|nr:coiled-coil domain-containing protein 120 isoform X2 [Alligator mississippiensis]KYO34878.1 coiled-coil domain-containing protein 120 isoform B [Alligator mississippiensis]
MEVKGQLITSAEPPGRDPGTRLRELLERQRGLEETLALRVRELRRLCWLEAELTGHLPPEYPLEPGERPQPVRRRVIPNPWGPQTEAGQRALGRQVQLQRQVLEAARRLVLAPGLSVEQRCRRQRVQAEAAQRLRQLEAQLGAYDEAFYPNSSPLVELVNQENGTPPGIPADPSPPRSRDHLRATSNSPDRCPVAWRGLGPDPLGTRRNSLASPPSASSFEGRSVPATPILSRGSYNHNQHLRPDPPRLWQGPVDSPTPGARRSNSSEALIERGGGLGDPSPPAQRPPPYAHLLLDYYLERQGRGGGGSSGSPPHQTRRAGRAKSCGPPQSHPPWGGGPPAPPRGGQKALALEGLREWYLRHAGPPLPPNRRGGPPTPRWPDPSLLPHSLSYAGPPPQGRPFADFLCPDSPPGPTPPRDPDTQPPGTLV